MNDDSKTNESTESRWQTLDGLQRRVLGVLVEKAKTTPDSYPLTVNSIKTACNQKSNRKPVMDLDADDVMATLDELREMGAIAEVQGDGRVSKYRHRAYQWFGVDKFELAVLSELLLRGEQSVGELRGRAARMEAIAGVAELKPILASLRQKGLLVEVTPQGRGQIVTHALYLPGEQTPQTAVAMSGSPSSQPAENDSIRPPSELPAPVCVSESVDQPDFQKQIDELKRRMAGLEQRLDSLV